MAWATAESDSGAASTSASIPSISPGWRPPTDDQVGIPQPWGERRCRARSPAVKRDRRCDDLAENAAATTMRVRRRWTGSPFAEASRMYSMVAGRAPPARGSRSRRRARKAQADEDNAAGDQDDHRPSTLGRVGGHRCLLEEKGSLSRHPRRSKTAFPRRSGPRRPSQGRVTKARLPGIIGLSRPDRPPRGPVAHCRQARHFDSHRRLPAAFSAAGHRPGPADRRLAGGRPRGSARFLRCDGLGTGSPGISLLAKGYPCQADARGGWTGRG
jgi:hypothetical protein